ncbi:MAG TPA: M24 family metallopeptidase [Acidimicrobiales bacterium]|nr:M24 family metallopeptidase [Acidimicrobiales bacterium]
MPRAERRAEVQEVARRAGATAAVLRRPATYAWYTGGADNRVDHSDAVGVAAIVVGEEGDWILANAIEADRIREEQSSGLEVVAHPWTDDPGPALDRLVGTGPRASDAAAEGEVDAAAELAALRLVLDAEAQTLYREVGRDARAAMDAAASQVRETMSEQDAAAVLADAARRRRLFAPVTLVAGARRLVTHRHPVPTAERLGARAMLVLCGERGGLVASLTRIVHFAEPDAEWHRRQDACETILSRMRDEATRPGRTMAEAFADCVRFYGEAGFPDEWRFHHQGGMAGYRPREVVAMPSATTLIEPGQAFAWNPSITGAKAEETFLLLDDGPEVVTGAS